MTLALMTISFYLSCYLGFYYIYVEIHCCSNHSHLKQMVSPDKQLYGRRSYLATLKYLFLFSCRSIPHNLSKRQDDRLYQFHIYYKKRILSDTPCYCRVKFLEFDVGSFFLNNYQSTTSDSSTYRYNLARIQNKL